MVVVSCVFCCSVLFDEHNSTSCTFSFSLFLTFQGNNFIRKLAPEGAKSQPLQAWNWIHATLANHTSFIYTCGDIEAHEIWTGSWRWWRFYPSRTWLSLVLTLFFLRQMRIAHPDVITARTYTTDVRDQCRRYKSDWQLKYCIRWNTFFCCKKIIFVAEQFFIAGINWKIISNKKHYISNKFERIIYVDRFVCWADFSSKI